MLPPPALIQITEIVRRLDQGMTKPFLCRAADGTLHAVKGSGGRDLQTLCREWIAGRLGKVFDLPIPPFALAEVPSELVADSDVHGVAALGSGLAFASSWVEQAEELAPTHLPLVPPRLKSRVLLFDRWIGNADRTLSTRGGNPNLLWTPRDRRLHVIDHNLAFEEPFDATGFWLTHVFRESAAEWTDPFRAEMTPHLAEAFAGLDDFWEELPTEWLWVDADSDLPTDIDRERVRAMLEWPFSRPGEFWRPSP